MNENHASTPSSPTMEVCWPAAGVAQVILGGEHDLDSADGLRTLLSETLATCSHLIVDLSTAEFIDSTTIRVLITTKETAEATHRPFNLLVGTKSIVERALEITSVLTVLNRVHTLEDALTDTPKPRQHATP